MNRARRTAIPKATLPDRARRKPIAIVDVQKTPEFKREKLIESDDEDDNKEEKEASPAKRESPKKKDSAPSARRSCGASARTKVVKRAGPRR